MKRAKCQVICGSVGRYSAVAGATAWAWPKLSTCTIQGVTVPRADCETRPAANPPHSVSMAKKASRQFLACTRADPPKPVQIVELPQPLPLPGQLKPLPDGKIAPPEARDPRTRVEQANDAARVQPSGAGYLNAMQVYPFAEGALYQIYAAPGEITDIALEAGEQLGRLRCTCLRG
jgi:hypothetical protein